MNKTVHTLDFEKILRILKDTEDKYVFEKVNLIPKEDDLLDKLQRYVNYGQVNRKAVLGIDIYKYSSYEVQKFAVWNFFKYFDILPKVNTKPT